MCWHGGPMKLDEYRQEVKDIYKLWLEMFERSQDDEVYEVILQFRDDKDLVGWGIWNKVFKNFDSVKKYILKEREFMDEEDEEPMVNRAYWSVTKYKLNKGEYEKIMKCCFSIDMQLLSANLGCYPMDDFLQDEKLRGELWDHHYLLTWPKNVDVPYQTGDILKVNAMPFGKDFYVIYGGELFKGDRERGLIEKYDSFFHECIYESEDRNGLWISDISSYDFTDYVHFENCPLIRCEQVATCPDEKITKISKILKDNPELWYDLRAYSNTIHSGESNLDEWFLGR